MDCDYSGNKYGYLTNLGGMKQGFDGGIYDVHDIVQVVTGSGRGLMGAHRQFKMQDKLGCSVRSLNIHRIIEEVLGVIVTLNTAR